VLTAIGNAGCSIVPWLVGVIINYSDIHIGLLAVMACPVGMMVLLVWMARWSRGKAVIPPP
ncbi:MFS transporter, partial [Pseudomonas syringae pv. pisi]